jgi:hypothetical protein
MAGNKIIVKTITTKKVEKTTEKVDKASKSSTSSQSSKSSTADVDAEFKTALSKALRQGSSAAGKALAALRKQ